MKMNDSFSRRDFLACLAAAAPAAMLMNPAPVFGAGESSKRFKLIGFSKPFQNLSFEQTADLVVEVGWDGIECPVRKGGQVLPERVEEDLPKLVESLKKRERELVIAVTDIQNAADPLTEKVLRTVSKLGIKFYRLAHLAYGPEPLAVQLKKIRSGLHDLAALNKELGLCALCENHSGRDSVGAAVWDIYELFKDFDRRYYGVCFDIGHATIEGGYAWPTNFRLIQPILRAPYVKDFAWKRSGTDWKAEWCPLGEGMVSSTFFDLLKKSSFAGPIVQHHEYPLGSGREMVKALKKDLETLKSWLGV